MRRGKLTAQQRTKNKVKQHTPAERMALRREKKRKGGCGQRRAERRKAKQPEPFVCPHCGVTSRTIQEATCCEYPEMRKADARYVPDDQLNPVDEAAMAIAAGVEVE